MALQRSLETTAFSNDQKGDGSWPMTAVALGAAERETCWGGALQLCSEAPLTGFYRDGCCHTGPEDLGRHVVCAVMTEAFLQFSSAVGNDLQTPRPEFAFPGLRPGDRWCLCADRWREADEAGCAPPVVLAATHQNALARIDRARLLALAVDAPAQG